MSKRSKIYCEYDYLEEDSDQERGIDSSEDEIDLILHGTPKQRRRLSRSLSEGSLDVLSSGDEFEKEMEMELEVSMKQRERHQGVTTAANEPVGSAAPGTSNDDKKYYDDVYFDSDDEGEQPDTNQAIVSQNLTAKGKKRQLVQSNEDLFYDPEIDDENQKWVDNQRSCYFPSQLAKAAFPSNPTTVRNGEGPAPPLPKPKSRAEGHKSDAILNCPACMTTLCLDCQRHEIYPTQYRAMFVLNCAIVRSEKLKYKPGQKKKRKWKKRSKLDNEGSGAETMGTGRGSLDVGDKGKDPKTGGGTLEVANKGNDPGTMGPGSGSLEVANKGNDPGTLGPGSGSLEVANKGNDPGTMGPGSGSLEVGNKGNDPGTMGPGSGFLEVGNEGNDPQTMGTGIGSLEVEEEYHPVKCAECDTEVAVYDNDEVYHFFNVISGVA